MGPKATEHIDRSIQLIKALDETAIRDTDIQMLAELEAERAEYLK